VLVESPLILDRLQRYNLDGIQGYAVSLPEPIETSPGTVH